MSKTAYVYVLNDSPSAELSNFFSSFLKSLPRDTPILLSPHCLALAKEITKLQFQPILDYNLSSGERDEIEILLGEDLVREGIRESDTTQKPSSNKLSERIESSLTPYSSQSLLLIIVQSSIAYQISCFYNTPGINQLGLWEISDGSLKLKKSEEKSALDSIVESINNTFSHYSGDLSVKYLTEKVGSMNERAERMLEEMRNTQPPESSVVNSKLTEIEETLDLISKNILRCFQDVNEDSRQEDETSEFPILIEKITHTENEDYVIYLVNQSKNELENIEIRSRDNLILGHVLKARPLSKVHLSIYIPVASFLRSGVLHFAAVSNSAQVSSEFEFPLCQIYDEEMDSEDLFFKIKNNVEVSLEVCIIFYFSDEEYFEKEVTLTPRKVLRNEFKQREIRGTRSVYLCTRASNRELSGRLTISNLLHLS